MDYQFQKFTDVGKRFEDRITVTRNRAVGFPTQFYKQNGLKNFKYGVLFYDSKKNAIGIKFTNDESEEGRTTINHSTNYGGHLLANSFFKANRINTKKFAGRYDYKKQSLRSMGFEEDGSIYIIQLKERKGKEGDDEES